MISSAAVRGTSHRGPVRENSELNPISCYGAHKRMAEELCLAASRHWQFDVMIVRFLSLYGAGLRKQIFWDLAERSSGALTHIELGGTGGETRDFLHVKDAARLHLHLAHLHDHVNPLIVNGGTGPATPIRQAAEELARACGPPMKAVFNGHQRPGDPVHLVADTERLESRGFKVGIALAEGLADFGKWHRELTAFGDASLKSVGTAG